MNNKKFVYILLIAALAGVVVAGCVAVGAVVVCERGGGTLQDWACRSPRDLGVCRDSRSGVLFVVPEEEQGWYNESSPLFNVS